MTVSIRGTLLGPMARAVRATDATSTRLAERVTACRRCPRLVAWREEAAADPPRRYRGERYWARPLPGFGDPGGAAGDRRPGAGRARRQPHRAHVHRRPLGRVAVRRRCTGPGTRTSRPPSAATTGCGSATPTSPRSSAARRRPTSRRRPSATSACRGWSSELRAARARRGCCWRSARSPGTGRCGRCARSATEPRARSRASATAPRPSSGPYRLLGSLPPLAAEHVHRQAHPRDARRGACARGRWRALS